MKSLCIGQKVEIYEMTTKKKLVRQGNFAIDALYPRFIVFDNGRYKISIQLLALRAKQYILKIHNGSTIMFKPLKTKNENKEITAKPEGTGVNENTLP
jgi:hypothetical protein